MACRGWPSSPELVEWRYNLPAKTHGVSHGDIGEGICIRTRFVSALVGGEFPVFLLLGVQIAVRARRSRMSWGDLQCEVKPCAAHLALFRTI